VKHRVEHNLDGPGWVVLDPLGDVVYVTTVWQWAIDDAVVRYNVWLYDSIIRIAYD
jgi:hypothetical protein